MAVEVIKEIKEAEMEASKIIDEANDYSKKLIKSKEEQAKKIIDNANNEAKKIKTDIINQKENEGNNESKSIIELQKKVCKDIKEISEDKFDRAVDVLIERMVNPYGSS